jgi:serine/threonine protein kinase
MEHVEAFYLNVMKILNVCSSIDHKGNDFRALVFEFMPNGNLEAWLHNVDMNVPSRSLNLFQRLNIAMDVATALDYLHNHGPIPIVHCDLKPSNVLLDENMTARVGDFGLARLLGQQDTSFHQSTTNTSVIKGSIGYIPPGKCFPCHNKAF